MCNKKQLIELVMNRPMGAVRYKLVRRLFQMTEKEAELLLKIMTKAADETGDGDNHDDAG